MSTATGGPPRALLHPRHWPSWLAIGLLSAGLLLPRGLRDRLAAAAGELRYRRNAKARGTVALNLARAFPERSEAEREALAREHFRAYARAIADQPIAWWDRRLRAVERHCEVTGLGHIHAAQAAGRPFILLIPHVTGVDFAGMALAPHAELTTMANRLRDPVLQWVVNRARARHGPVWLREGGIRPVVRALRQGTSFYYMPDEDQGLRDAVFAPFFGVEKATLTALGRLAQLAGAQVLPTMVCYDPARRRYAVEVRAPLAGFPTGDARADATTMNRALEESIRRCPAQYLLEPAHVPPSPGRQPPGVSAAGALSARQGAPCPAGAAPPRRRKRW
ncbi:MAG: lipid A biosynthesis acyltransferase [Halofilum sp. (in: g-proteobacteria)]|nr:lipid A biosynthesis acyltransferase [Halofilum sp. (in: g-proteobacteria)]